jgi:hypothetical protein
MGQGGVDIDLRIEQGIPCQKMGVTEVDKNVLRIGVLAKRAHQASLASYFRQPG